MLSAYPNLNGRSQASEVALRHQSEAWDDFTALMGNASLTGRSNPVQPTSFASDKESVWETWKQHYEVYLDNGEQPEPWHESQLMPTACQTESNSDYPFRGRKVLDSIYQAVKNNATLPSILTDQSSNTVHYEIRMNKVAFDYIMENNLYNGISQSEVSSVNFPLGSILIKAAWSEVTEQDNTTEFIMRQSCILCLQIPVDRSC